jgi:hypothetical protein
MPCGACSNKNKPPSSPHPVNRCKQCGWPTRIIHRFNIKTRKNDKVFACTNNTCRYVNS